MKPGDTFDRYTILRPVGRGGMGEVYRAQDTRLFRNVALKILQADAVGDTKARAANVERLFREARAAAALQHPNVVVIHDVGEVVPEGGTEPVCYIAMEYIEGLVLRELVGRTEIAIEDRIRWMVDVARALAFAHARGIVHRDVKPDNVIVRDDGVVKVLDFGIARRSLETSQGSTAAGILPTLTERGVSMGTPKYMSPEQMLNESLDGRADQYSWGLTAYELLAGSTPWSGTVDSVQHVASVLTRAPEPLSVRAPEVPVHVARAVDRCLSRKREDRFSSMDDVLTALGAAAEPTSPVRQVVRVHRDSGPLRTTGSLGGHPQTPGRANAEVPTLAAQHSTRPVLTEKRGAHWRVWALGGAALVAVTGTIALRAGRAPSAPPAAAAAPKGCIAHAECRTLLGEPAVCRGGTPEGGGTCARLASEDCRVSTSPGDVENPATIWIGAMFPLVGDDAKSYGTREFQAVDLARADFAQMLAGATQRAHGARPIALVACDDAADARRAIHHLVDEVGVPAVIGFRSSNEAIEVATSTLIPKGVMGVAALNTSPMLSSLPAGLGGQRMTWRTTFSAAELALPVARLVPDVLEPDVRAKGLGRDAPLRVALLRQDDAAGLGFADVLFRTLRFNGRSALENEAAYHEFVYAPDIDATKLDDLARKMVAFAPHVVVDFGGDGPFVSVVATLERLSSVGPRGTLGTPPNPRPRYVKAGTLAPSVVAFLGANAERRHRFLGLTSESSTAANARFVARYNEAYSDSVTRTFSPNSSYDAFYLVAYAALALGDSPVTGASLSHAVGRLLPPGKPIDVGPTGIFDAMNELASGRNIDLNGATGGLDFDPATGDAPVDLAVLCADVDAHGSAASVRESGMVYDATTRRLMGALRCP